MDCSFSFWSFGSITPFPFFLHVCMGVFYGRLSFYGSLHLCKTELKAFIKKGRALAQRLDAGFPPQRPGFV
jgi:hypothetical protein